LYSILVDVGCPRWCAGCNGCWANGCTCSDWLVCFSISYKAYIYSQELSCCWDGRAMLHKSGFCFQVGLPLFNAVFLSNLRKYHRRSYIAKK